MSKIVVGNMKMLLTKYQIENYIDIIDKKKFEDIDLILCPSYIYLSWFNSKNYSLGAQNVFYKQAGPYTGEISPMQLKDLGVKYSIVGHSERRILFNETDEMINKKIKACLEEDLNVILCIGENKEQKDMKKTAVIIKKQIIHALSNIKKEDLKKIIIAYEPVYVIGKGYALDIDEITSNIKFIKKVLKNEFDYECKVIYGGGVSESNIKNIVEICDGVMIGKLCNDIEGFINLINKI